MVSLLIVPWDDLEIRSAAIDKCWRDILSIIKKNSFDLIPHVWCVGVGIHVSFRRVEIIGLKFFKLD